jgi:predicted nucleic acid-binding Zn ribbon protein
MKISAPNPPCPECAVQVEKKVSRTSFVLKGGGWYKDLYSGPSNKAGGDKSTSESAGESSDSKSDSSTPKTSTTSTSTSTSTSSSSSSSSSDD